jgi:hypothetical protein
MALVVRQDCGIKITAQVKLNEPAFLLGEDATDVMYLVETPVDINDPLYLPGKVVTRHFYQVSDVATYVAGILQDLTVQAKCKMVEEKKRAA